jgi:hypothetical protein
MAATEISDDWRWRTARNYHGTFVICLNLASDDVINDWSERHRPSNYVIEDCTRRAGYGWDGYKITDPERGRLDASGWATFDDAP